MIVGDAARAPQRQIVSRCLVGGIRLYRATLSPVLGMTGVHCRFEPSCSRYAEAVLLERGLGAGLRLSAWRILRCGPWTEAGTVDPPPLPAGADR